VGRIGGVLAGILFTLASCDQAATRVSTLWTNVPEVASYVERFNASQRDWQILVEYKDDPVPLLLTPGIKADLVVARGLASTEVMDTMVPLDFLFDGGNLAKASFYRKITDAGQQGDHFKLLPVSFDLPVLIFSKNTLPDLPGSSVDLDTVQKLSVAFDGPQSPKVPRKLSFSPLWETFGFTWLQLQGVGFREGFQGTLTWDSDKLNRALAQWRAWPSPGPVAISEFQRKYLQGDPIPMLTSGRMQFYPSTLANFESKPWDERRNLDFRFLDRDGKIVVSDNIVWAGIPLSSLTRGAGERFLAWLFQVDVQKKLLLEARTEDDRNFGLARGLSSLTASNEAALVEGFPEMAGRLPGVADLSFWNTLPPDWRTLKSTVLRPWLEASDGTESSLKTSIDKRRAQASRN